MTKAREAQIRWWAVKVREQALMYADVVDPNRTHKAEVANILDAIAGQCQRITWVLEPKKKTKL